MARLDKERQTMLEPKRMEFAKSEIEKKGYEVYQADETKLIFEYMGHDVNFFPYSG